MTGSSSGGRAGGCCRFNETAMVGDGHANNSSMPMNGAEPVGNAAIHLKDYCEIGGKSLQDQSEAEPMMDINEVIFKPE